MHYQADDFEQRTLNKTVSTTQTDKKAYARKGKNLVAFNAKKIFFKSRRKFKIYFLLSKSVSLGLHFYNYIFLYNFKREW